MAQIYDHGEVHKSRKRFAAQASSESVGDPETSKNVSPERRRFILEAIRCTGVEQERQRHRDVGKRRPRASGAETSKNVGPERLEASPHFPDDQWISWTKLEDVQDVVVILIFAAVL